MTERRAGSLWIHAARSLAGSDDLDVLVTPLDHHAGFVRRIAGRFAVYIDDRFDQALQLHALAHEAAHVRCEHIADDELSEGAPAVSLPQAERELIELTENGPAEVRVLIADREAQAERMAAAWLMDCDAAIGAGAPLESKLWYLITGTALPDLADGLPPDQPVP